MENYKIIKQIGGGYFGVVFKAIHLNSGEIVAIKMLREKCSSKRHCVNFLENRSLRVLNHHPNLVKLKELIWEDQFLYFVFEYMQCGLQQLMEARRRQDQYFSEDEIRDWCFQVFHGLNYIHENECMHRDIKPDNLLLRASDNIIKIGDFGMTRPLDGEAPYTQYFGTREYVAPEVYLHADLYSSKVDMWAMGATMFELYAFYKLFPYSWEVDEIHKTCRAIGSPTEESWPEGFELARKMNYEFPEEKGVNIAEILIQLASEDAIDLITSLCSWNPSKRPTAAEALKHPFFQSCNYVPRSPSLRELPDSLSFPKSNALDVQHKQLDTSLRVFLLLILVLRNLSGTEFVRKNLSTESNNVGKHDEN